MLTRIISESINVKLHRLHFLTQFIRLLIFHNCAAAPFEPHLKSANAEPITTKKIMADQNKNTGPRRPFDSGEDF